LREGTVVEVVLKEEEVAAASRQVSSQKVEGRPLRNEPLSENGSFVLEPLLDGEVVIHEESEPLVAEFEVISGRGPHFSVHVVLLFVGHFLYK
jgi:hypothetical protein